MSKQTLVLSLVAVVLATLLVAATSRSAAATGAAAQADATYSGSPSCRRCHTDQHATWTASLHSRSWESLPEKYHEPAQVDGSGKACVACHATGFGEAARGGFADVASTPNMVGVQCEACHGPGSLHVEASKQLVRSKRKTFAEDEPVFITLTPTNCASCHNPHVSHAEYKQG